MKIRPEAEIWPQMSDAELAILAEDIRRNKQQVTIKLYKGEILDGRNRFLAMTKFCDPPLTPKYEEVDPPSPIQFAISQNEHRRHMNESQRGYVAALALPFFEAEAKARQEAAGVHGKEGGRGNVKPCAPIGAQPLEQKQISESPSKPTNPEIKPKHRAADDAAQTFHTSPRNVQRGKAVVTKGSDKLKAAVAGGHLSLGTAEDIIKKHPTKSKQDLAVKLVEKSKSVTRVKGLTGEVEWYTPARYIAAAVAVMGAIDLDPASSVAAQASVKAGRFYTIEDDGITQPWAGRVFLNPPYAMPFVEQFSSRMASAYQKGEIEQGILLTNNATDTNWFHNAAAVCSAICFTRGRISFLRSIAGELNEMTTPTHGQSFMYFGPNPQRFADVFSSFGLILTHVRAAESVSDLDEVNIEQAVEQGYDNAI